jgi:hypothetical protein
VIAKDFLDATLWVMLAVEIGGSVLVIRLWPALTRTGRLAGGWFLAATVFGLLGQFGRFVLQNSQISTFFWFPVSALLAINALASIHPPGRSRSGLRLLSWVMVLGFATLALTVEQPGDYSKITSPAHAILLAAAAAYTLITRVEASRTDLLKDPSFVIAAFWLIYAVPTVFLSVAARMWVYTTHYNQVLYYYSFRNTIVIVSYFALLYGISLSVNRRRESLQSAPEAIP